MIFIASLLFVVLHEVAHAVMAVSRGLKVKGIKVGRKGIGVARERGTHTDTIYIALAGPLVNLLLAAICYQHPPLVTANLILAVTNLLPIPGSDGSQTLAAVRALRGHSATGIKWNTLDSI